MLMVVVVVVVVVCVVQVVVVVVAVIVVVVVVVRHWWRKGQLWWWSDGSCFACPLDRRCICRAGLSWLSGNWCRNHSWLLSTWHSWHEKIRRYVTARKLVQLKQEFATSHS